MRYNQLAVIFIFLLMLVLVSGATGCTPPPVEKCYDSDGGINYEKRGFVEDGWSFSEDVCISELDLMEYYCSSGRTSVLIYQCPEGCEYGACVIEKDDFVVIDEMISSLSNFDKIVEDILQATGNIRSYNLLLSRGEFTIDGFNDKIEWYLGDSNYMYSKPGVPTNLGNILILTEERPIEISEEYGAVPIPERFAVTLTLDYAYLDLTINGEDGETINPLLEPSKIAYELWLENKGVTTTEKRVNIDISIAEEVQICETQKDCLDYGCDGVWIKETLGIGQCEYGQEITCNDGFDNDADGFIDEEDDDCIQEEKICLLSDISINTEEGYTFYNEETNELSVMVEGGARLSVDDLKGILVKMVSSAGDESIISVYAESPGQGMPGPNEARTYRVDTMGLADVIQVAIAPIVMLDGKEHVCGYTDEKTLCIDSDGGKDYYTPGYGDGIYPVSNRGNYLIMNESGQFIKTNGETFDTFYDYCRYDSTYGWLILEAFCDYKGKLSSAQEKCPYGCEDGACIIGEETCNSKCDLIGYNCCYSGTGTGNHSSEYDSTTTDYECWESCGIII